MLQEIEARELDCEILVLSEYSDFEYMHQAIHAHVADYLLKPIDSEQLNDLLRNAALRLDEKRRLNHVSRDPLSKIFVSAASEGRPGAYEEICRKYATGFAKTALQVCSIQFCADSKSYPVILQKVNLLIKDAPFPTRVLPYSESRAIFCLFSAEFGGHSASLSGLASKISAAVQKRTGHGCPCRNLQFRRAYHRAARAHSGLNGRTALSP